MAHRARVALPPAQTRWHGGSSRMDHQLLHRQARQPEFLPHGQEPLGDRESRLQRRQESLRHGAHLPPPAQQYSDRLVIDLVGLGDRTPLPVALSAPWRPWHSQRSTVSGLPLVEPVFWLPAGHKLNLVPCGRQPTLLCSLTTRPLCCGAIPRQEPAVAQRPTGTLPPPRFKSAPQRRLLFRETSETAGLSPDRPTLQSKRCKLGIYRLGFGPNNASAVWERFSKRSGEASDGGNSRFDSEEER